MQTSSTILTDQSPELFQCIEHICAENNAQVKIGNEHYFLSADGRLMPTRKDQPPPDLTYFKPSRK